MSDSPAAARIAEIRLKRLRKTAEQQLLSTEQINAIVRQRNHLQDRLTTSSGQASATTTARLRAKIEIMNRTIQKQLDLKASLDSALALYTSHLPVEGLNDGEGPAAHATTATTPSARRMGRRQDAVDRIRVVEMLIAKLRSEGADYKQICERLDAQGFAPKGLRLRTQWRYLPWVEALHSKQHRDAVKVWICKAARRGQQLPFPA